MLLTDTSIENAKSKASKPLPRHKMEIKIKSHGQVLTTIIDEEDWPLVAGYVWCAVHGKCNIYAGARTGGRKGRSVFMHRLIIAAKDDEWVDHKNRDTLDNRKANLRLCSPSQNAANTIKRRSAAGSKYLGVYMRSNGKFAAQVRKHGKRYWGGLHESEESAALAYNELAARLHGDFARLNIIR